jgi:hypothetical protein
LAAFEQQTAGYIVSPWSKRRLKLHSERRFTFQDREFGQVWLDEN